MEVYNWWQVRPPLVLLAEQELDLMAWVHT